MRSESSQDMCRACLTLDAGLKLSSLLEENVNEKFLSVTGIAITADNCGLGICENCLNELQNAFGFKERTRRIDRDYFQPNEEVAPGVLADLPCDLKADDKLEVLELEWFDMENFIEIGVVPVVIELPLNEFGKNNTEVTTEREIPQTKIQTENAAVLEVIEQHSGQNEVERQLNESEKETGAQNTNVDQLGAAKNKNTEDLPRPSVCGLKECEKMFKTEKRLKFHQTLHHNKKRLWFKPDFSEVDVLAFKCSHEGCGKNFKSQSHLISHQATHSDARPFKCTHEGCGKDFKRQSHLTSHQATHSDARPFKCTHDGCGKDFKSNWELSQHQATHSDARPIKCTHEGCGKDFKRQSHLISHQATHSDARPFKCTHEGCDKHFKRNWELSKHQATHSDGRAAS